MDSLTIRKIETIIQYEFKNKKLLEQAFLIEETPDNHLYSSEVFRIPGKKAISYVASQVALEEYGSLSENGYTVKDKLLYIKEFVDAISDKDIYTTSVTMLNLTGYLTISNPDAYDDMTRRLLEAIVGAIALDTDFDNNILKTVVPFLLDMDFYLQYGFDSYDNHYVAKVYNWCVENNKTFPVYQFVNNECHVRFGREIIVGVGKTKTKAKFDAAKKVFDKLKAMGLYQEKDKDGYLIGKPNILLDDAVNYLEEKSKQNRIGAVSYTFADEGENSICICQIEDVDQTFDASDRNIEMAKKKAAYKMISYLMGYRVEEE